VRLHEFVVIDEHKGYSSTRAFSEIDGEIRDAIECIVWPPGSERFVIKPAKHGNGVRPIKKAFTVRLESYGWEVEQRVSLVDDVRPGPIDATKRLADGSLFLLEWETGNVSSSHRSINRMLMAMTTGMAVGGAIIVVRAETLYPLLTDRVANDRELRPYFELWRQYPVEGPALLALYVVDYDGVDDEVEQIPKGADGWALLQRKEP